MSQEEGRENNFQEKEALELSQMCHISPSTPVGSPGHVLLPSHPITNEYAQISPSLSFFRKQFDGTHSIRYDIPYMIYKLEASLME